MLRLRPYKPCDAEKIASWIDNERTFLLWGGNHFCDFPLKKYRYRRTILHPAPH